MWCDVSQRMQDLPDRSPVAAGQPLEQGQTKQRRRTINLQILLIYRCLLSDLAR